MALGTINAFSLVAWTFDIRDYLRLAFAWFTHDRQFLMGESGCYRMISSDSDSIVTVDIRGPSGFRHSSTVLFISDVTILFLCSPFLHFRSWNFHICLSGGFLYLFPFLCSCLRLRIFCTPQIYKYCWSQPHSSRSSCLVENWWWWGPTNKLNGLICNRQLIGFRSSHILRLHSAPLWFLIVSPIFLVLEFLELADWLSSSCVLLDELILIALAFLGIGWKRATLLPLDLGIIFENKVLKVIAGTLHRDRSLTREPHYSAPAPTWYYHTHTVLTKPMRNGELYIIRL